MSAQANFDKLIERLGTGDEDAGAEIVSTYEQELRRFVRFRLSSPSIRRFVDSLDVTQSVLAKLFVELRDGDVSVRNAKQLRALLLTMARNKLYDQVRREHAGKRDARRIEYEAADVPDYTDKNSATASEQFARDELIQMIRRELSDDELYLIDQRFDGRGWDDLASEFGSTPDAVRKRMTRAVDRAAKQLGVI